MPPCQCSNPALIEILLTDATIGSYTRCFKKLGSLTCFEYIWFTKLNLSQLKHCHCHCNQEWNVRLNGLLFSLPYFWFLNSIFYWSRGGNKASQKYAPQTVWLQPSELEVWIVFFLWTENFNCDLIAHKVTRDSNFDALDNNMVTDIVVILAFAQEELLLDGGHLVVGLDCTEQENKGKPLNKTNKINVISLGVVIYEHGIVFNNTLASSTAVERWSQLSSASSRDRATSRSLGGEFILHVSSLVMRGMKIIRTADLWNIG